MDKQTDVKVKIVIKIVTWKMTNCRTIETLMTLPDAIDMQFSQKITGVKQN